MSIVDRLPVHDSGDKAEDAQIYRDVLEEILSYCEHQSRNSVLWAARKAYEDVINYALLESILTK